VHLHLDLPVSLTLLATPTANVEGESARQVAPHPSLGEAGEQVADLIEDLGVGGRIRARRTADRSLIDIDDFVEMLEASHRSMFTYSHVRAVKSPCQRRVQKM
jgi:hypothetical protein